MSKKFNIYTAIVYATGKPHIGNTYEIILTDAIARYKRLSGFDVYFQTGTDEHGQKIEKEAIKHQLEPQEYVDQKTLEIKQLFEMINSSHDKFVRTSNPIHKEKVAAIFEKLYQKGDIYKGFYEGLYCIPCESFWLENQIKEGKCPDCGRLVETAKEEAYFFKLSKYADQLIDHIEKTPDFIVPESRKNEIANQFLKVGLEDLCVSRTSFNWGIPVKFDQDHVIYVWLDALTNYITFAGYPDEKELSKKWPADVHVIGKDIIRFHTIYWPIILMALDLPLPKQIFGHPWVLIGDSKISKSKGNLVYVDDLINHFGVDEVRYYFLSQVSFANDGLFTYELLIDKINADLVNNLGNLVNRTLKMTEKYFDGEIPEGKKLTDLDKDFQKNVLEYQEKAFSYLEKYQVADALQNIFFIFDAANKYVDDNAPWQLAKEDQERLKTVIYNLLEAIRHGGILLAPFMPKVSKNILEQINAEKRDYASIKKFGELEPGEKIGDITPLFERIDKEKKLQELV